MDDGWFTPASPAYLSQCVLSWAGVLEPVKQLDDGGTGVEDRGEGPIPLALGVDAVRAVVGEDQVAPLEPVRAQGAQAGLMDGG